MKKCTQCLEAKYENEFYKRSRKKKDGTQSLRAICKSCTNENSSNWAKKNPDKILESANRHYRKYADKICSKSREKHKNLSKEEKILLSEKNSRYRIENKEVIRRKQKEKYDPSIQSEKWREYYKSNQEKELLRKREYYYSLDEEGKKRVRKHVKDWQKRNPEKTKAHGKVYRAVKSGKLVRPSKCEKCESDCRPEAHHEDYSKPLEVSWLCKNCHALEHIKTH